MHRKRTFTYVNRRYGFSLVLPKEWKQYCVVDTDSNPPDGEYAVQFRFRYRGKLYDNVLTVILYRMTYKQWVKEGYLDSPMQYLGERRGLLAAGIVPGELPDAFIDPKTGEYNMRKYGHAIRLLKRMVNDEAPRAFKSFRFLSTASAAASSLPKLPSPLLQECVQIR